MKNIRPAFSVIRRRWFIVCLLLVVGFLGSVLLLATRPKAYEAASHVLIVNETFGRDPSVSTIDLPIVASSTVVLDRVIERLHLTVPLIKLKRSLKIKVGQRSSIMEIIYRDDVADRAIAVPNAVAEELAKYYEQISSARANVTVRKLDSAIDAVQQRLRRINRELAAESAEEPFLGSDKALDDLTTRLDDLQLQRELAGATLTSDEADLRALTENHKQLSAVARHEMLQNDPLYVNMVQSAARDTAELTFQSVVHTRNHPEIANLIPKVSVERASVSAEAKRFLRSSDAYSASLTQNTQTVRKGQALVIGDRAKIAALDRIIVTEHARLAKLPRTSVTNAWLKLQRDSAQADYLALTNHRNVAVASRAEALSLGSVVVVDRAVRADTATVGLSRSSLLLACAFFVLILSIGSAFLAEMLDPRLRRRDQFEKLYGAPLLVMLTVDRN